MAIGVQPRVNTTPVQSPYQAPTSAPGQQQVQGLLQALDSGTSTQPQARQALVEELLLALRGVAGANPGAAENLLEQIQIAAPGLWGAIQSAILNGGATPNGIGAPAGGVGIGPAAPIAGGGAPGPAYGSAGDGYESVGAPVGGTAPVGGPPPGIGPAGVGGDQGEVNGLAQSLAQNSPIFSAIANQFPGSIDVQDIPDPEGVDIAGLYAPATDEIVIDSDNVDDPTILNTIAEEVAHRAVSQAALDANPNMGPSDVVNQSNEVIAKTYANLMVAEANGQPITPELMDQAIGQALQDVEAFYGGFPPGNYGALLDNMLAQTNFGFEAELGQRLEAAMQGAGFQR